MQVLNTAPREPALILEPSMPRGELEALGCFPLPWVTTAPGVLSLSEGRLIVDKDEACHERNKLRAARSAVVGFPCRSPLRLRCVPWEQSRRLERIGRLQIRR